MKAHLTNSMRQLVALCSNKRHSDLSRLNGIATKALVKIRSVIREDEGYIRYLHGSTQGR